MTTRMKLTLIVAALAVSAFMFVLFAAIWIYGTMSGTARNVGYLTFNCFTFCGLSGFVVNKLTEVLHETVASQISRGEEL